MSSGLGLVLALGFALLVTAATTAERWIAALGAGQVTAGQPAPLTVRVPPFAGYSTPDGHLGNGGIVIARGDVATISDVANVQAIADAAPASPTSYLVMLLITFVLGALFTHHMRRSPRGRSVHVQLISLGSVVVLGFVAKALLLLSTVSVLAIPVAAFAIAPAVAIDRIVGVATGLLAAVVVALLGPFDVAIALILLVQVAIAAFMEHPHDRVRAIAITGAATIVGAAATFAALGYLTMGGLPALIDPLHSGWLAVIAGPALGTAIAMAASGANEAPAPPRLAALDHDADADADTPTRPRSEPGTPQPRVATLLGASPANPAAELVAAPASAGSSGPSGDAAPRGPADATPVFAQEPVIPMLVAEPPPEARKRAATLPPTPSRRAPTVPPPAAPARRTPSSPPPTSTALLTRTAGPPSPVTLDNAVTNPPLNRSAGSRPPASQARRPAAMIVDEDEVRVTLKRMAVTPEGAPLGDDDKTRETKAAPPGERDHELDDPATTVPVMRVRPPTLPDPPPPAKQPPPGWSRGLAARVDAALDGDEWSNETPVVAPTKAELRILLGTPDPTREQSIEEVEALHRVAAAEAAAAYEAQPELLPARRPLPNTAEVDPDDIEAAIEIAPPARKPSTAIAVAKTTPKKPE
ncbi:MAG: hypothetical protein AB7L28_13075 [Kofleriaceae bacterium]